ncbi:MAG: ATP-binding protein, partial [Myxococcales bacterium]|nr:ATP-binding protein [Myxococcales bacterium]
MESTQTADSQRAVSAPDDLTVAEVIERLVHADPDPFVCLRELVQNAIDANGREIDVGVVFEPDAAHGEPSPDDLGLAELAVEDRGDGMGREVIEGRLVRLFASVGDVEPDRIGHLGTGFVTVFALDPTLVVVDSSWRGEHWRVLFDRDRGYSLRRRPRASFGTAVRVFKRTRRAEAEALRAA